MAELAHDASSCLVCRARIEAPRRLLQVAALFAAGLCVTTGILELRPQPARHAAVPAVRPLPAPPKLRVPEPARRVAVSTKARDAAAASLTRAAAISFGRPFFTGDSVFTTAARVAQWRPLVRRAAHTAGISPALLEAVVFVESSGRADVSGGTAVGLTQLHPAAARKLGLHVDQRRSNRLTRQIAHTWGARRSHQLRRWRARYDERYAPAKALRATATYIGQAKEALGREDLAVEAYHTGPKPLHGVDEPYASLYFRTRRVDAYGFKVLAAERVMRLYRSHPSALRFEAQQQARKNSSEEYMHPLAVTHRFGNPAAILSARKHHVLRAVPFDARETHIAIGPGFGGEAHKLGRSKRLYRALRPQALDVLLYIGSRVHEMSHAAQPLILTSAVRDNRYQRALMNVNVNAARSYSLHTTGFAFDIARVYSSERQARAFQAVLDRLTAANAIAYIRETAAIHIAVASDATKKLKLLSLLG